MFGAVVFIGTLNSQLTICKYTSSGAFIGGQGGCYNLDPVFGWIQRCIISIFLVFMIAFLPLFLQGMRTCLFRCLINHLYFVHCCRTCQTWHMESYFPSGQAVWFTITCFRSLLNSNLHSFNSEQSDVWRGEVHRNRSWICHYANLFQHLVLSLRGTKHILGHAYPDHVTLRHSNLVDALLDLLLVYRHVALYRALLVQSSSICVL